VIFAKQWTQQRRGICEAVDATAPQYLRSSGRNSAAAFAKQWTQQRRGICEAADETVSRYV